VGAPGGRAWSEILRERALIFVTVGTDGPFDRLVSTIDQWAARTGYADVFAQIGKSTLRPDFIRFTEFLEPPEFTRYFASASLVVSHAGMGTILTALRHQKPLLVMPRRAALGEQRNDHQLATARRLQALGKVSVAFDEGELVARLGSGAELGSREPLGPFAQPELIAALRGFIEQQARNGASRPSKG
jgi:UDP-N-acetylglucosamine transferase subunit ALG13